MLTNNRKIDCLTWLKVWEKQPEFMPTLEPMDPRPMVGRQPDGSPMFSQQPDQPLHPRDIPSF